MFFKQITLQNFRQFKNKMTVKFSEDIDKNVTIIIGENGTGKTSFAQAFTWCLYGKTYFKDQDIFSKSKKAEMQPGETAVTFVELGFVHQQIEYTLRRSIEYKMDSNGNIGKPFASNCVLTYKKKDGQTETVKGDTKLNNMIDGVLPKELSRYFLFDGERVERMSEEIQSGQSDEFAEAVRRILGLDTYLQAMIHLKGDPKKGKGRMKNDTVIGRYNRQYSAIGDKHILKLTEEIDDIEEKLEELTSRRTELEDDKPKVQADYDKITEEIARNKASENIAHKKQLAEEKMEQLRKSVDDSAAAIFGLFQTSCVGYFSQHLIARAIKILSQTDIVDKGVPFVNDKTIDYILRHHRCICGQEVQENSSAAMELKKLLEFIPPKSLGNMISSYVTEGRAKITNTTDLYENVKTQLHNVSQTMENIEDLMSDIEDYDAKLDGMKDIEQLRLKQRFYSDKRNQIDKEIRETDISINELTTQKKNKEAERNELSVRDKNNRNIVCYKAYAEAVYEAIEKEYFLHESKVRKHLEECINRIFLSIYSEGLSLNIDSKYNVKTVVSDIANLEDEVETSTAQSISVVFAFISGVIETAIKFEEGKSDKDKILSTEAYPLVMDAPLSSFDKKRIKTVCDAIPEICQQVIIFIKDTDGEIAHKYLLDKIGTCYTFNRVNSVETEIEEGLNV